MRSLNLTDDASYKYKGDTDNLDETLKGYRDEIVSEMKKNLSGTPNASSSDVYGGVTNNSINGGYGHYKDPNKTEEFTYWYTTAGEPTHLQEIELWAEFFAAKMTNNEAELASLKKNFPNAYKAMEKMAEEMAAD